MYLQTLACSFFAFSTPMFATNYIIEVFVFEICTIYTTLHRSERNMAIRWWVFSNHGAPTSEPRANAQGA